MSASRPSPFRLWIRVIQGLVTLAVFVFAGRSIARNWAAFQAAHTALVIRPAWILASAATVLVTYVMQIESWRWIIAGWRQKIGFGPAWRAWSLSNLGRYVPGKIWSVAGLVVLARDAGVDALPAAASAVAVQAVSLGTAIAVSAATVPHSLSAPSLVVAGAVALATIGALIWDRTPRIIGRWTQAAIPLDPLPAASVLASSLLTVLTWISYGAALWMLAHGLLADAQLPMLRAIGAFTLGYLLGLLALFAPGGVGIRELVLVDLLTPSLGPGGAVAVSLASRVLLTLMEVATALLSLPFGRRRPVAP